MMDQKCCRQHEFWKFWIWVVIDLERSLPNGWTARQTNRIQYGRIDRSQTKEKESNATKNTFATDNPPPSSIHCRYPYPHCSLSFPSFHGKYSCFILVSCDDIHYMFLMGNSALPKLSCVKA